MTSWIVLPTVRGREQLHAAVRDAWKAQADVVVTVRDAPTVGEAWNRGYAEVAPAAKPSDLVCFAIDDALPHPDALKEGAAWANRLAIPSPRLLSTTGAVEACGSMGGGMFLPDCADGTPCRSAGIILARRSTVDRVGAFLPIHYYVDDDWCWRAALLGVRTVACPGFVFQHRHASPRRAAMQALSAQHRAAFLEHAAHQPAVAAKRGRR